jgi:plasmid maintenance system antidote protein VapI
MTAILQGKRGITAGFWLNLQKSFELRVAEIESGKEIAKGVKPRQAVDRVA